MVKRRDEKLTRAQYQAKEKKDAIFGVLLPFLK